MRKLLLMMVGGALAIGANAQQNNQTSAPFVISNTQQNSDQYNIVEKGNWDARREAVNKRNMQKGTGAGGERWYDHYAVVNDYFAGGALEQSGNRHVFPIWFDSTATQRFVDQNNQAYYGSTNFMAIAQYIDPITSMMFNDPSFTPNIAITAGNEYFVDSVFIIGAYVREQSQPTNQVDTLIFSVAPQDNNTLYLLGQTNYPKVLTHGYDLKGRFATADTAVRAPLPPNVDSNTRTVLPSDGAIGGRAMWKVPIGDADGDTTNTSSGGRSYTTRPWIQAVGGNSSPTPLKINKGERIAFSVVHKSGGTWTPNVDSVMGLHRFMPVASNTGSGLAMPYYYRQYDDRNMSQLMFRGNYDSFTPTIFVEIFNEMSFSQEFFRMGAYLRCADCEDVSVKNINNTIINQVAVFPNPANNIVTVPFEINQEADVTVSMFNTVGQMVNTKTVDNVYNGKVQFNTADLAAGVYMVTIEANGSRRTGRVVVAH